MTDSTIFAAIAALVLAVTLALSWRAAVRARRLVHRLQEQVAQFERERASRPALRVTFEFSGATREALVHVTNDGGDALVHARMSVEGALTERIDPDLRAQWLDDGASTKSIRRGEMRTLRLAELDLSVFPYAQWQIFAVRGDEALSLRAMNSSTIGGDPETHAPPLFMQVAVVSSPDPAVPPPDCTIALQPFEAVRLRA